MKPLNKLSLISKMVSLEALVIEVGIGPSSLLVAKISCSRLKSECPTFEGRLPENLLNTSANVFRVDKLNMECGMEPDRELLNIEKCWRNGRVPISCGNSPATYTHGMGSELTAMKI